MIRDGGRYRIVLVTCGSIAEARKIGRSVVEKKLAACANIVSGVESIYRWKGKVERAREVLVLMKTTSTRLRDLEREVKRLHSYDVPEFIVLAVVAGSQDYLEWIGKSVSKAIVAVIGGHSVESKTQLLRQWLRRRGGLGPGRR